MCPSYYEINVSRNGRHFFATHKRSVPDKWKMNEILEVFKDKFPESEGYRIMVTAESTYGEYIYDSKGEYTK